MGTRGAGSGLDFCLRLPGSELELRFLCSSTAYSEDRDGMGVLIELVAFLEVLAPDPFGVGFLTLTFISMAGFAGDLAVLAPRGTVRVVELSVLFAYLVSIGFFDTSAVPSCLGQASRGRDSHFSSAKAQDADE